MTETEVDRLVKMANEMCEARVSRPRDAWHPEFGWVLVDGKPGPGAEEFIKKYAKKPKVILRKQK